MAATKQLPGSLALLARAAGTMRRRPGERPDLRHTHATYFAPSLSERWLNDYHAFFGGFRSEVPLTALYPLAQRAQMAGMVRPDFPYPVAGMIHLSNDLRLVTEIAPRDGFELELALEPVALPGAPGWECLAFEVTYRQAARERAVCRSLYLARRRGRRSGTAETPFPPGDEPTFLEERWSLDPSEGRRYARLSGDFNPIHLSPWLSRWFGFQHPILHGMDGVGRAVATIERELGRPLTMVQANFERAVSLPSTVLLRAWQQPGDEGLFAVTSVDETVRHVTGAFFTG